MPETSRLVKMRVANLGCIGPEGCEIALDNVLCLVGPNNTGKSTFLRGYELALGTASFDSSSDLCRRAGAAPATVEIWVHIPEGMANIAEKWKEQVGELRLVRSKWEWSSETNWAKTRTTWDPESDGYSTEDKASGLDTVFNSRLPVPFRIGSLEDPDAEHKKLLEIVLEPVANRIRAQMDDDDSHLRRAIAAVAELAKAPVDEEEDRLNALKADLNRSHNAIFPDLKLDFDIGIGEVSIDPMQMLLKNSRLTFMDWLDDVTWKQQGTGSQRALFWTMLQVRSRLKALADVAQKNKRAIADLEKKIKKLAREEKERKSEDTKAAKRAEIAELQQEIDTLAKSAPEKQLEEQTAELSLPGYMLLIDEPEVALHPNAIRAASRYLYGLTEDRTWQVILATHSPLFIDPLHDHTTIVRLARSEANPTPKTYRSDSVVFSPDERENLKMLNRFDQGLAEMFFGQLPVLIEGDTEFAAFEFLMNTFPDRFPLSQKPVLVRARGKHTLLLVMKILGEFLVPFAVLHDADMPLCRDGKANGAWAANAEIHETIRQIRSRGVRVVHRVSVPGFEYAHMPVRLSDTGELAEIVAVDKPWRMAKTLKEDGEVAESVLRVLADLTSGVSDEEPFGEDFDATLMDVTQRWARANCPNDARFGVK